MHDLVILSLATFWAWETARYVAESFAPTIFSATRAVHPLVVAALPLAVLWPAWLPALAVAGATGLLVAVTDRYLSSGSPQQIQIPTRRGSGLPPLPGA